MNATTASVRDIIVCLSDQPQWMRLLLNNGKPYSKLINFLLADPYFTGKENGDFKTITVTRFASELREKSGTVNKWIREIYDDIYDLNDTHPELFINDGEIRVELSYCPRNGNSFFFTIGLPVVPREYERLSFYFVKALCRDDSFVVKRVEHMIRDGMRTINLELVSWFCVNRYQDLLAEKAEMLNMLSFEERFEDGYNLRKILLDRFRGSRELI